MLRGVAIYHLSAKLISRAAGRSVVAAAAYRAAERLQDERLGRAHDFTGKTGVVHREVLLSEGAPAAWSDRATLWNAVEAAEKRKDAQLAREVEVAIPRELSRAEGIALARDFATREFVARGMVADVCVHWPTGANGEAKPHAHILLTTRRVEAGQREDEAGRFGAKARDWNSTALLVGWRERWAALANERLAEQGHEVQIDHRRLAVQGIDLEPQHKVGPAGARREQRGEAAERAAEHRAIARRNGARLLAEPERALEILTAQQSTFTRRDLARLVDRQTDEAEQFAAVMAKVEASPVLVRLGRDERGQERLTTRGMLEVEQRLERDVLTLAGRTGGHAVDSTSQKLAALMAARSGPALSEEQQVALGRVLEARDLVAVVGHAGTGKSTLLAQARLAWGQAGYRVQGAALSGIAVEGLERGSRIPSRTLASLEHAWSAGRERLRRDDVLVVDEAGLVGSRQLGRVLAAAREAGAKVVLVGDAEQLQAIEAGAAFRAVVERVGAAEVTEVRRQHAGWQREATAALATGRTAEAIGRYEAAGMVVAHATADEARAALVAGWAAARQESPQATQLMLAHTRADVAALNAGARAVLREAGALGADHLLATARGPLALAAGERVMFLRNERGLGVRNGTTGTLERIDGAAQDGSDARLVVRLDAAGGAGEARRVAFQLRDYGHLAQGYAATVHKAQGATVDRAHLLATPGMDRHLAYVGLTRHREAVALHWSAEEHGDREAMVQRLSRERAKDTTLDYRGEEVREAAAAFAARRGLVPAGDIRVPRQAPELLVEPVAAEVAGPVPPLLAAHHNPQGRDSLGRGTTPGEVAAAVERDRRVEDEQRRLRIWLENAYRDPDAAWRRLEALEQAESGPRGAARALRQGGAALLGELRGKTGWFAAKASQAEREQAERCAGSIGPGLVRLREVQEQAAGQYRGEVEAQRARDAVAIPGLSQAAWAAVRAVEEAGTPEQRRAAAQDPHGSAAFERSIAAGEAWARTVVARPAVAAELRACVSAAMHRLGEERVRAFRRQAGGAVAQAADRPGLAGIGRVLAAESTGRLGYETRERVAARQREGQQERPGLRQGRGMRM